MRAPATKMNKLQNTITNTAYLFRVGAEGEGSRGLLDIINTITSLLNGKDVQDAAIDKEDLSLLNDVAQAQQRGDFIYIADLLEYELPKSALWKFVVDRIE